AKRPIRAKIWSSSRTRPSISWRAARKKASRIPAPASWSGAWQGRRHPALSARLAGQLVGRRQRNRSPDRQAASRNEVTLLSGVTAGLVPAAPIHVAKQCAFLNEIAGTGPAMTNPRQLRKISPPDRRRGSAAQVYTTGGLSRSRETGPR